MRIMMLGDVCSKAGRAVLRENIHELQKKYRTDFTVVNGENVSGGNGITEKNANDLLSLPIDVLTMGNHVWNQKETANFIDDYPQIVRPANYPEPCPGKGFRVFRRGNVTIGVMNLSGQVYMPEMGCCPFALFDRIYESEAKDVDILLVDFHAEATSEKIAFGYHLNGRASVVAGTHTHVQTADVRILDRGTAFITDMGMTGPLNGVIGVKKEIIVNSFLTKRPARFEMEHDKPWQINGILAEIDEMSGRALSVERIYEIYV